MSRILAKNFLHKPNSPPSFLGLSICFLDYSTMMNQLQILLRNDANFMND